MHIPTHAYHAHKSTLRVGDRAADMMRNGLGSWIFFLLLLASTVVWIARSGFGYDLPPYQNLNLVLGLLSTFDGIIILIAAKRQDQLAAAISQAIYENAKASAVDSADIKDMLSVLYSALELNTNPHQVLEIIRQAPRPMPRASDTVIKGL